MMRATERIADPNVAAFYMWHCGWRAVVLRPNPIPVSWWGKLFTWWSTIPVMVKPNQCCRVGAATLVMGEIFHKRVNLYLNSYRLEARERIEGRNAA